MHSSWCPKGYQVLCCQVMIAPHNTRRVEEGCSSVGIKYESKGGTTSSVSANQGKDLKFLWRGDQIDLKGTGHHSRGQPFNFSLLRGLAAVTARKTSRRSLLAVTWRQGSAYTTQTILLSSGYKLMESEKRSEAAKGPRSIYSRQLTRALTDAKSMKSMRKHISQHQRMTGCFLQMTRWIS